MFRCLKATFFKCLIFYAVFSDFLFNAVNMIHICSIGDYFQLMELIDLLGMLSSTLALFVVIKNAENLILVLVNDFNSLNRLLSRLLYCC